MKNKISIEPDLHSEELNVILSEAKGLFRILKPACFCTEILRFAQQQ
jgi:hypothetical protein